MKQPVDTNLRFGRMYLYMIVIGFLISIVSLFIFSTIWSNEHIQFGLENIISSLMYVFIGGVVLHEILHAITWGIFAKKGFKSIKFGFKIKYLTPYCHCKEALRVKHYKLGAAMPLIILGIIPSLYGIVFGDYNTPHSLDRNDDLLS
ncbi:MAG: DUF3267 domain-containing protein [Bacteroidales bacterium]|nr:DUF3267 domain-containing protein [Bacteroidales bacterium]